jgi:glutaredoxin-like YruB-family protein
MTKTTIYTTPTCSYCHRTKKFFKDNNVDYEEIDVSADEKAAQEMIKKSGQMGVPVISVEKDGEEQIIVGYQPDMLSVLLGLDK